MSGLPVVIVAGVVAGLPGAVARDVTTAIRAGRDVRLTGDSVVTLTGGTIVYSGVMSGTGTLTVAGTGTLVLLKDSDFTLPAARRGQRWVTRAGNHPLTEVHDADPPAVIVRRGAKLQYGDGTGATGMIGHFEQRPGFSVNTDNIRVDGTLEIALKRPVSLGVISGSGYVASRRSVWPGVVLAGTHPFSGVIYNGTGTTFASPDFTSALPNVRTIVNQGSWIMDAPIGRRTVLTADVYSRAWGNDINFHSRPGGLVVMTGVYSWADTGSDPAPSLSDPALNFKVVAHRNNKRGINIEGARVQWGDGRGHRFFLPGNKDTVYINMHARGPVRSRLTFDYDGPVTLAAPISGGIYHDTLTAPGEGDVVVKGGAMTFAVPQNYNGSTTIERGASLQLGASAGDSGLRGGGPVINRGTLVAANPHRPLILTKVTGTGATTITAGTLRLGGPSSSLHNLTSAPGTTLDLRATTLRVVTTRSGTFAGRTTGTSKQSRWQIGKGRIRLDGTTTAAVTVAKNGALTGGGIIANTLTLAGTLTSAGTPLKVTGKVTGKVTLTGTLRIGTARPDKLTVLRTVTPIAGTFAGLPEGAPVPDTPYKISYRGGNGHDSVLTRSPAAPTPAARRQQDGPSATHARHLAFPLSAAGVALLAAAGIPLLLRRRRRHTPPQNPG